MHVLFVGTIADQLPRGPPNIWTGDNSTNHTSVLRLHPGTAYKGTTASVVRRFGERHFVQFDQRQRCIFRGSERQRYGLVVATPEVK